MGSWLTFVRKTPCLTLLVVQLSGVVIYPFLGGESSYAGRTIFASLGILALLLVIRAVRATPWFSWFSGLVFVPALLLLAASIVTGEPVLIPISAAFEAVLYGYAGIALLAYMLHDSRVTTDELFAIPTVFTLFAWAFAFLFVVVQALDPGAFGPEERTWMELLYVSFTTLSSVGLSDIGPATGHARSVIMLEQVVGIFYIAMVVTRLVSLRAERRSV
ncbi:MAG: ion channel [Nocardioides sp.]